MATYPRQLAAVLGVPYAGQAANLTYTVKDTSGTVLIATTGAGITESSVSPGTYLATNTFTDTWCGRVEWQITGTSVGAVEPFGPVSALLESTDATAALIAQALPAHAPNTTGGLATLGETGALLDTADTTALILALLAYTPNGFRAITNSLPDNQITVMDLLAGGFIAGYGGRSIPTGQSEMVKTTPAGTVTRTQTLTPNAQAPTSVT